ncbi:MAG: HAD family phosphatase [Candidatus Shapirobacteria bacterium]|nr:HAD family phosphatase [Candidatus Shapirobacteria bacterium]MDD4410154.1 HAD family phosphatase [Candidatus Shapirobacteria bacterium]
MIKAIIFDFGNVICRFTNEILIEKIGRLTNKTKEEIFELIYKKSDLQIRYETGLISSQEFFEELSEICGLNISYEELKEIYSKDKYTPVEGTKELIEKLQKKYKIGLLSNTSEWDFDYMIQAAPIIKTFETITTSFGAKAMKPSQKIFEDALNKLKLKAEDCIYTDDILEYVEVANKMGIKAIQFTTAEKFESDLKEFGVELE